MAYVNLPGTYASLVDGNLRQFIASTDPLTLIIGTAATGFTGELYTINDIGASLNEFGLTSELSRGVVEARDGGASNMIALRLPGTAPVLTGIGAEHSAYIAATAGFTVTPVLASPEAADKYAIAYQHVENYDSVAGGIANSSRVVARLCVVDVESQETVWYGDLATGRSSIDAGLVNVDFDTFDVGTVGAGVVEDIEITFGASAAIGTIEVSISGNTTSVPVLVEAAIAVGPKVMAALNLDPIFSATFTATAGATLDIVKITANGAGLNTSDVLVYPTAHDNAGVAARPVFEDVEVSPTGVTGTVTAATVSGRSLDVGVMPLDPAYPFARFGGGAFVTMSGVVAEYNTAYALITGATSLATMSVGDTGQDLTLMERYEKMDQIFRVLDFKEFDLVVPQGVLLDSLNVGEGAAFTYTPASASDYPLIGSTEDILGKLAIVVDKANYTETYYWDLDNDGIAELSSDGVISADASVAGGLTYHEVNFGHQLAKFCYESSENFQFCHGVIGTTLPASQSTRGIKEFFGYSPVYTYDQTLQSDIVESAADNGQGILGHKLVGGRYGYHLDIRGGGIPLTKDGHLDSSNSAANIVTDRNGKEVDLGKYLSVVAAFANLRNETNSAVTGYLANLSNVYAGLVSSLPVNVNTTNRTLSAAAMRYYLPASVADEAAGSRLITVVNKQGSVTIADGPTFALLTSDYSRLTTMRIVAKLVEEMRETSDPFLGKGMSTTRRLAHETALQKVIQGNIADDKTITSGSFILKQTRSQKVLGQMDLELNLTPVFELRQIFLTVSLSVGA